MLSLLYLFEKLSWHSESGREYYKDRKVSPAQKGERMAQKAQTIKHMLQNKEGKWEDRPRAERAVDALTHGATKILKNERKKIDKILSGEVRSRVLARQRTPGRELFGYKKPVRPNIPNVKRKRAA
jgi:hypothetical protein